MSEVFKLEIINPEKSFLSNDKVSEVVIPAFEGEMGILKDHIPIISFLKPGILKVISKSSEEKYYLEDGIVEFKDNNLSILTSFIVKTTEFEKDKLNDFIQEAEKEIENPNLNDQKKYLIDQKIEALKLLSIN